MVAPVTPDTVSRYRLEGDNGAAVMFSKIPGRLVELFGLDADVFAVQAQQGHDNLIQRRRPTPRMVKSIDSNIQDFGSPSTQARVFAVARPKSL